MKKANQLNFAGQKLVSIMMNKLQAQSFQNVTVYDFIWGYGDDFFKWIQTIKYENKPSKFGVLAKVNIFLII